MKNINLLFPLCLRMPFSRGYANIEGFFFMEKLYNNLSDKKLRLIVFEKFQGKCAYCGCILNNTNYSIDHITPLNRHIKIPKHKSLKIIENFNPCCRSCNSSKNSLDLEAWRSEIILKMDRLIKYNSSARLLKRMGLLNFNESFKFYFEKNG